MNTLQKFIATICVSCFVFCIFAACETSHFLDRRYDTTRGDFGSQPLPNPGPDAVPEHVNIINPDPVKNPPLTYNEPTITGTWTFTTPTTTTRVEHKTATFHQFSIYEGRPAPTDTPFVVITVTANPQLVTENDPAYKITGKRTYTLNGNIAKETIGTTKNGGGFAELVLSKPGLAKGGGGDQCHALALPRNADQRKLALDILGSITWTPASNP